MTAASRLPALLVAALLSACGGGGGNGGGSSGANVLPPPPPPPAPPAHGTGPADCVSGDADGYACSGVALAKHVTLSELGGNSGSDIWGWVDAAENEEYVLMGLDNGTAFVRVTDPENPVVVGRLPTGTQPSAWRDMKAYRDHAYVVADNAGMHGMQVFDLARLRSGGSGQTFGADHVYADQGLGSAHNVAINEATGRAYVVGSNTCDGGLHLVNLDEPINPLFAGCHFDDGYTHDADCVVYGGPDPDHAGAEICFNANEDHVAIVDVSQDTPLTLSTLVYPDARYVHQAIVDPTHRYVLVGDEADETDLGLRTGTIVIDVTDLDAPQYLYTHRLATRATDHNLMVGEDRIYQANYQTGLRILAYSDLAADTITELAWFDTYPDGDDPGTDGAWGVYARFPSGTIAVSDTERGLFLLREQ